MQLHHLFPFLIGQLGGICSVRGHCGDAVIFPDAHNPLCVITDRTLLKHTQMFKQIIQQDQDLFCCCIIQCQAQPFTLFKAGNKNGKFATVSFILCVCVCVGPVRGWFQRSQALQIQTCLRMLLDWAKGAGRAQIAQKFFSKLCSAVTILITPVPQLSQVIPKSACERVDQFQIQNLLETPEVEA